MPPQRIQRKRAKGWRMPAGAVCVTRPGRWGNPFKAGGKYLSVGGVVMPESDRDRRRAGWERLVGHVWAADSPAGCGRAADGRFCVWVTLDAAGAVHAFRAWAEAVAARDPGWLAPLRGKDLACWCREGEWPCHGDVLLQLCEETTHAG